MQAGGLRVPTRRRSCRHLNAVEREEISRGIAAGPSARAIGRLLERPASTISREIRRNGARAAYRACEADAAAQLRARRPKQAKPASRPELRALVQQCLDQRWSPEQSSGFQRGRPWVRQPVGCRTQDGLGADGRGRTGQVDEVMVTSTVTLPSPVTV
ncbi:transposase [Actinomadura fibrosa]|uniref:Transposase n=1 Tax=Actinomadura fibrosa TaxID=111802 RepID=A0ABW2Y3M7_9ACTN